MKIWLVLVLLLLALTASAEQDSLSTDQYYVYFDMGDIGPYETNITETDSRFYAKIASENNTAVIIGYETPAAGMNLAKDNILGFIIQAGINNTSAQLYTRTIDGQMAFFAVAARPDGRPLYIASYPKYLGDLGKAFYVEAFSNFPWEEGSWNLFDSLEVEFEPLGTYESGEEVGDYGTPYSVISNEDESFEEESLEEDMNDEKMPEENEGSELPKTESSEDLTYKGHITFSNNGGESIADAIIIHNAKTDLEGVDAEYFYLENRFGKRGTDWSLDQQSLLDEDGAYYDAMDITLSDGSNLTIYFDITDFLGKK
jgi:hypothetical protein